MINTFCFIQHKIIDVIKKIYIIHDYYFFFSGWIRDYTGSYAICLHAQNMLLIIVIIIWLPEILYRKWKEMKKRTQHPVAI